MATMNEILELLNNCEDITNTNDLCTYEATIRITNLPNIEDKLLLKQTIYEWLYDTLSFGIEEHVLEHHLEDAGIELEDFVNQGWEIDDDVILHTIGNN